MFGALGGKSEMCRISNFSVSASSMRYGGVNGAGGVEIMMDG